MVNTSTLLSNQLTYVLRVHRLIKIKPHVVVRGPYRERTFQNVFYRLMPLFYPFFFFFFFQNVTNNTARQTWEITALTL